MESSSDTAKSTPAEIKGHDPYAALREPGFRLFLIGNLVALLGIQMQSVAVGWEIYERTRSNLALGFVGLIQILPVLFLALPAGQLADRMDRKKIVLVALSVLTLGSLGLASVSLWRADIRWMYVCLLANGICRAIQQPAKASLLPHIVPRERFANAVTWNVSVFQFASIVGPALAGILIACFRSPALIYLLEAASAVVFCVLLLPVALRPQTLAPRADSLRELAAGLRFVWNTKIILGALSLDLFAVLLGGATTLLPVFAKDVLDSEADLGWLRSSYAWGAHLISFGIHSAQPIFDALGWGGLATPFGGHVASQMDVEAIGLGCLRAAPAIGALGMSFLLAHRPPLERAGRALLWSVAGFGVATVVFGLSRSYWLSLLMLLLTGALDMISVVVRHTLVQLLTPDEMRGRVTAVNGMFIGASNELGGFESGLVAALFDRPGDRAFGPTVSVVSGGIGTILVVAFIAHHWPEIRRYGRLDSGHESRTD